jgi:protein ImuB
MPTLLPVDALVLDILDGSGERVWVTGRGALSAEPVRVLFSAETGNGVAVTGWAGPWPCDERWWDQSTRRRRARLQLMLADGRALLVQVEQGNWSVEAVYD